MGLFVKLFETSFRWLGTVLLWDRVGTVLTVLLTLFAVRIAHRPKVVRVYRVNSLQLPADQLS